MGAEQEAAQQCAVLVLHVRAVSASVLPEGGLDLVPHPLVHNSLVLARVEDAFVVHHAAVKGVGEDSVESALADRDPATRDAGFGGPTL